MLGFATTVAYIRSFGKSVTFFFFEVLTTLVADGTGRAFAFADNDFVTYVSTLTPESTCAEVVRVIEYAIGMYIIHPVKPYLLGYGCRILA